MGFALQANKRFKIGDPLGGVACLKMITDAATSSEDYLRSIVENFGSGAYRSLIPLNLDGEPANSGLQTPGSCGSLHPELRRQLDKLAAVCVDDPKSEASYPRAVAFFARLTPRARVNTAFA